MSGERRHDIEGLRGVSVAAVVLEHTWHWPIGGYLGVDVFFVISGFVICTSLLRQRDRIGRIDIVDFTRRRLFRLLPSATVVVGTTLALVWFAFPASRARSSTVDGLAGLTGWANWRFAATGADYFDAGAPPSVFRHMWSLGVEEQFYLAWPVLLLVVLRWGSRRLAVIIGAALAVGSLTAAYGADGAGAYFATQYRVWELLAGCLLSLAVTRSDRLPSRAVRQIVGLFGTALLLVALWLGDSRFGAPFPTSVPAVAGAVLLIFAGVREGSTASAMLSSPPLRALGAVSYPLYLWHWPLLIIAPAVMPGLSPVVVVVMALLAAVATHAAVERPMTDLAAAVLTRGRAHSTSSAVRRWRSRHRTPVRYGTLLMLCVVTVCVTGMAVVRSKPQSTVPDAPAIAAASPTPSEDGTFAGALAARDALVRAGTRLSSWPRTTPTLDQISVPDHLESVPQDAAWADTLGCSIAGSSRSAADCTFGDTDGDVVAVVGDSTAAFTMPAFRQIAERAGSGVQVVNLAQFACPFTALDLAFDKGGACSDHKDDVVRTLAALRPDVLVVMNTSSEIEVDGHALSDRDWAAGIGELIGRVRSTVREVVIALPNPPGPDLRECAVPNGSPESCESSPAADRARAYRRLAGVTVVDTARVWCSGRRCPAVIGDNIVRLDSVHVAPEAAVAAADALQATFRASGVPLGAETH